MARRLTQLIVASVLYVQTVGAETNPACKESLKTAKDHALSDVSSKPQGLVLSGGVGLPPQFIQLSTEAGGKKVSISAVKYLASVQPAKGAVVYLCGGPQACAQARPSNVPPEYDVVTFDYIGLGQNGRVSHPPESMSLESQAVATLSVVRAAKLNDYFIYGASFGSAVATVAAAQINKDPSLKQPKALLLEGVLPARKRYSHAGYKRVADRAWSLLSADEKLKFRSAYQALQKKIAGKATGNLERLLTQSLAGGPKDGVIALRNFLTASDDARVYEATLPIQNAYANATDFAAYQAMGCQTMKDKTVDKPMMLFDGLVRSPYGNSDFCMCRTIARDYDPGDFQVSVPIIYLHGAMDAAVTIENAKSHFDSQRLTNKKTMITAEDGGHSGSFREWSPCLSFLYSAAMAGEKSDVYSVKRDFTKGCPADWVDSPTDSSKPAPLPK